jgi:2,3-bisphosphoglycerate-dependent phosphoglycerate mutase
MRIFLVRHARSEGNEDETNYQKRGDSRIELTDPGWRQAIAAGHFIKDYIQRNPASTDAVIRMWSSTHMRTRQTSAGIIYGSEGLILPAEYQTSPLLVEQNFGIYNHLNGTQADKVMSPLMIEFYEVMKEQDKYTARPPDGESPMDVQTRQYPFIGKIMNDRKNGIEDTVVVTHGVTLRVLAMAFMKIDSVYYKDFPNPENASVYLIEGDGSDYYKFKQIYNGETMQPVDIDWGNKLHAYKSELPEVPERFKNPGLIIRPDPAP